MMMLSATGNLTRNAETRQTTNDSVTTFTVAVNIGSGENKRTEYLDCALWGKRGTSLEQYLTTGTTVSVHGVPRARHFTTKQGEARAQIQVRVVEIGLHGGRSRDGEYQKPQSAGAQPSAPSAPSALNDEIPF